MPSRSAGPAEDRRLRRGGVRYAALAERAEALGATVVATAHTRNDSGRDGPGAADSRRRDRRSGRYSRAGPVAGSAATVVSCGPLLGLTRDDTEAVCRAWGFEPVEDPSNADLAVPRNRIRAETLPLLRRTNRQVDAALARLAEQAGAERALLETLAATAADGLGAADGAVVAA